MVLLNQQHVSDIKGSANLYERAEPARREKHVPTPCRNQAMHRLKALVTYEPNHKFKRTTKRSRPLAEPQKMAEDEAPTPQMVGLAEDDKEPSSSDESVSVISSSDAGSPADQAEVLDAMPASEPQPPAPAVQLPEPALQPEAPGSPAEPSAAEQSAYLARRALIQAGKKGPLPPGTHSPQQTAVPDKPDEGEACPTPSKTKSSEEPSARTPDIARAEAWRSTRAAVSGLLPNDGESWANMLARMNSQADQPAGDLDVAKQLALKATLKEAKATAKSKGKVAAKAKAASKAKAAANTKAAGAAPGDADEPAAADDTERVPAKMLQHKDVILQLPMQARPPMNTASSHSYTLSLAACPNRICVRPRA